MPREFYIVPIAGDGVSRATGFRPKYAWEIVDPAGGGWAMQKLPGGMCLFRVDAPPAVHSALALNGDVQNIKTFSKNSGPRKDIADRHGEKAKKDMKDEPIFIGGEEI